MCICIYIYIEIYSHFTKHLFVYGFHLSLDPMPLQDRLQWLKTQCVRRQVHISIGQALDPSKVKVKITVQPSGPAPPSLAMSTSLCASLDAIAMLSRSFVCMDRGHQHSVGTSVVALWMHPQVADPLPSDRLPHLSRAMPTNPPASERGAHLRHVDRQHRYGQHSTLGARGSVDQDRGNAVAPVAHSPVIHRRLRRHASMHEDIPSDARDHAFDMLQDMCTALSPIVNAGGTLVDTEVDEISLWSCEVQSESPETAEPEFQVDRASRLVTEASAALDKASYDWSAAGQQQQTTLGKRLAMVKAAAQQQLSRAIREHQIVWLPSLDSMQLPRLYDALRARHMDRHPGQALPFMLYSLDNFSKEGEGLRRRERISIDRWTRYLLYQSLTLPKMIRMMEV